MDKKWQYRKIGEVCIVERGGSPRPIDQYITDDENGINWIKIGDTTESMYITETAQKIKPEGMKKSRYVQPGDFLLSNSMSFGRPYILKIDGCIHDGWLVLRDKDELFDKRFLYYCLSSKTTYQKFKGMAVGGVVNNLNSEMVRKVDVPVPSKSEQAEIADLLDKLNSVIVMRQQELQKLDELIKARFVEMFEGWKDKYDANVLGEYLEDITYGFTNPMPDTEEGPWKITAKDVVNGIVNLKTARKTSQEAFDELTAKSKPQLGDVLLTKDGTLGRTAVVDVRGVCVNQSVAVLRTNSKILPNYLSILLQMPKYQRDMVADAGGGTIKHIYITKVIKMPIIVPTIEEQEEFLRFVEQVDKSKSIDINMKILAILMAITIYKTIIQEEFA